jgi:hypothetical protein
VGLRENERLQAGLIAQIGGREQCCPGSLVQREGEVCIKMMPGGETEGTRYRAQLGMVVISCGVENQIGAQRASSFEN